VYAFSLACPHQHTTLRWQETITSSNVRSTIRIFTATAFYIDGSGRATRGMDRFAVRRDNGNIAVDLDKLFQQDEDAAGGSGRAATLIPTGLNEEDHALQRLHETVESSWRPPRSPPWRQRS